MKKTIRKILVVLLIVLLFIQFIRIDKTNPTWSAENDFLVATAADEEIATIIKTSCYDCHSNQTNYPWYTNIAPVSWWIKHHINEGREELNFSEWVTYKEKRKNHKMEECVELVEAGEMPMSSYTIMHSESKLTAEQKEKLISFFNSLRSSK
jgi:hypothetical protein